MLALTAGSPSLPDSILLAAMVAYWILIAITARRVSASTAFLVIAVALRLGMSALPRLSYALSPLGLSWNALASVALIVVGALLLHRSRAVALVLPPVIALAIVVALSMVVNEDPAGGAESLVKYAYFAIIALIAYDASVIDGMARVLSRVLVTFTLPLALQAASIVLGIAKATESDGSTSYIGGYNHEASFSIILLTGLLVAALHPAIRAAPKLAIVTLSIAGIAAANYRTAIVAAAPLVAGLVAHTVLRAVVPRQRPLTGLLAILLAFAAVPFLLQSGGERFAALAVLADDPHLLAKSTEELTQADRDMLSGRLFLWSQYRDAWSRGTPRQHLLGFGANAWEGRYRYYAHNTLVSTLYELGTVGVAAMILLWLSMFSIAFSTPVPLRLPLVTAHVGFFLLNMATMPFWMVEGLLFYGLLCGFTIYGHIYKTAPPPLPVDVFRREAADA